MKVQKKTHFISNTLFSVGHDFVDNGVKKKLKFKNNYRAYLLEFL
jgi:hypothetical protein